MTGKISRKTLTEAIYLAFLAFDCKVHEKKLVSKCDVLFVSFDSSCFGTKDFLGLVMLLMNIEQYGTDAIGQIIQRVNRTTLTLPCTEVTDKLSQDIQRNDGSLFAKEVPSSWSNRR